MNAGKLKEGYDAEERRKQKAESRAKDAEDLRSGRKSAEDLRVENGCFAFGLKARLVMDPKRLK